MSHLDSMLKHNKDFAARQSVAGTLMPSLPRALPNVKAIIIGCADMRVDPAHVLGITPGEAVVMRNIGGRITPGLLEQLGLLGRIGEVARERFLEEAENFTSLCSSTPIAASLALQATPPCWRTISKYEKGNSRQKRSPIPARQLPSTLLCSGRFQHCLETGWAPVSFMTWQPDLLRSSYRRRQFAPLK
jgi:Carbonic anhydrase